MAASVMASASPRVHTITPSKAHAWGICGGLYQARYGSAMSFQENYASRIGTATHELAAAHDRFVREVVDIDALIVRNWRKGRFSIDEEEQARVEVRKYIGVYSAIRRTEQVQVLGSEVFYQTVRRSLGNGQSLVLSGRMDRVVRRSDGLVEVLDLKTGAQLPTTHELAKDPATIVYYLLAAERYAARRIVVAQLSLHHGARIEIELQEQEIEVGKEQLREMARQMADDRFALVPSGSCAFCPAREQCPALRHGDGIQDLPF